MKKFLMDSAEIIIYASAACILIVTFYSGIQLIRLSGTAALLGDGAGVSPLLGIFVIIMGAVFAALHCVVCLSLVDIRTYTRFSAKMLNTK